MSFASKIYEYRDGIGTVSIIQDGLLIPQDPQYTDVLDMPTKEPRHLTREWRNRLYQMVVATVLEMYGRFAPVHVQHRIPTVIGNSQFVVRRTDRPGEAVIEDWALIGAYNLQGGTRGWPAVVERIKTEVKDKLGE